MAAEAAKARAAAIAAKLSASLAGGGAPVGGSMMSSTPSFGLEASTELGKRKGRWSEQVEAPSPYGNGGGGAGFGASKRNKVPIPEHLARGGSIMGMLLGPKGSTIRAMQEKTGAKIQIRGRGSNPKPGDDHDADEPLHVMIEGSDQAVSSATREIQSILHNPEEANRLKHQQLTDLASMRSGMGMNTSGMPSANSPYGPPSNLGGAQYSGSSLMGGASNGGGVDEAAFEIPNAMVGVVIGRGGENIQRIQREFGVNIQVRGGYVRTACKHGKTSNSNLIPTLNPEAKPLDTPTHMRLCCYVCRQACTSSHASAHTCVGPRVRRVLFSVTDTSYSYAQGQRQVGHCSLCNTPTSTSTCRGCGLRRCS
eukprot:TRINITY_DN31492_c0_g1_i1.p1 TRINITY_DN31492_c0_g1~~TRINITY_DN31492_c0_g1_i1.p1  ORF type:complete len:376 (-),score=51.66 TRINITY_DN31492_c0_g1_i1:188-1288(-)